MTPYPLIDPECDDVADDVAGDGPGTPLGLAGAGDQWLATLAHELRSPLGAVLMSLDELRPACAAEPDARAARDSAERGSRQMARVIEDVLDLCRGTRGLPPADRAPVDLHCVMAGAVAAARPLLVARRHRLSVQVPARLPPVDAQASRVEQVLTNLLVNAAKFTEPGGHVRLSAEVAGDAVVLRVADDGIGIAPDLLPHVFAPYRQGPASAVGGPPVGLGIGLALVRWLVELQGGTVTAHSDGPGRGAEFVVRLPARPVSAGPAH